MRKLSKELYICGAFEGECLEDLEIALEALDKEYHKVYELIL